MAAMLMTACSEEDDKTYPTTQRPTWTAVAEDFVTEAPTGWTVAATAAVSAPSWKVDLTGSDTAPQWTAPDNNEYPVSMTAILRLTPFLEKDVSAGDLIAAFIGNECRGVSSIVDVKGVSLFFLYVKAKDTEARNVQLRYYSKANGKIYVAPTQVAYETNKVYGTATNPEYPDFEKGGKYPVSMTATVKVDRTPQAGDVLAAFVDDDCRGVATLSSGSVYNLEIRGKANGESVVLKYYDAAAKQIIRSDARIDLQDGSQYGSKAAPEAVTLVPETSMTAYVTVPGALASIQSADDKVAAFIGSTCCGVGTVVGTKGTSVVYKLVISAAGAQSGNVSFRYYNAACRYVFSTEASLAFADESVYGTADSPQTLALITAGKHPLTMNVVCQLPTALAQSASSADVLAAFVGDECRGLATYEESGGTKVFQMTIHGALSNDEKVTVKYFCSKTGYLYQAGNAFVFASGKEVGTAESPYTLSLTNVSQ
jgi:hypothetical protein